MQRELYLKQDLITGVDNGNYLKWVLSNLKIIHHPALLSYLQDGETFLLFYDIVEELAINRPTTKQELYYLFENKWENSWLSDGFYYTKEDKGLCVGEGADGFVYNPFITIEIDE